MLRQPMSEGSFCVSDPHKVRFSPATELSSTLRPFHSAIVLDNAMHRPTIVVRETERKLLLTAIVGITMVY